MYNLILSLDVISINHKVISFQHSVIRASAQWWALQSVLGENWFNLPVFCCSLQVRDTCTLLPSTGEKTRWWTDAGHSYQHPVSSPHLIPFPSNPLIPLLPGLFHRKYMMNCSLKGPFSPCRCFFCWLCLRFLPPPHYKKGKWHFF